MTPDLKAAWRGLRRSPAFTIAAVATMALGIGANTTMFSIVNSVLLRPLPGYETDRVVQICGTDRGGCRFVAADVYLRLIRGKLTSFEFIAANQNCRMNLTGSGGEPEQLAGPCTTANWFVLQHAQAMLGRTFLPDEDKHGRNHVAVLDYGFWQRRFGGDRNVLNKPILLDGEPWIVAGVMPPDFKPIGAYASPIYTAYVVEDNPHGLYVLARLKPGVRIEAARSELNGVASQMARENPADWKDVKLDPSLVLEQVTGPQRPLLTLLLCASSFVLLIACVNVASLMLARSAARQHEIDIRMALGASRAHIVRFVLAEALTISLFASLCAVGIAYGALRVLAPLTSDLSRAGEIGLDARVLACAMVSAVASALIFGVVPAFRSSNVRVGQRARPQKSLIVGEVALAFVLLAGTGLFIRTFVAIRSADLGFNPHNVLTNFIALPASSDGTRASGVQLFERIRNRVAALPGVQAVATASRLPMFGVTISMDVRPEGEPERRWERQAFLTPASTGYLRAMQIPLKSGRLFGPTDREGSTPVAIVSESISKRYFAGQAAGKRIILPEFQYNIDGGKDQSVEIVGVVGNTCVNSVENCDTEFIYLPESQAGLRMSNLIVRTTGDSAAIAASIRQVLRAEAPGIPLEDFQTLEERASYLSAEPKRAMWLLSLFAGLALVLAAVGIHGVTSYFVAQRTREIGIRMALGAGMGDIAGLVYREILMPSALGLVIGLGAAVWLSWLIRSMLAGVRAGDPRTLGWASAVLLAAAILAGLRPALRAAASDPAQALRRD